MEYDNTNTGMLRKNGSKQRDSHPDYRGMVNVNGDEYWLSAWVKVGREGTKLAGEKYMSLALQPKDDEPPNRHQAPQTRHPTTRRPAVRQQPAAQHDDMGDDDIPF